MSGWTPDQEIEQAVTRHLTTVLGPKSAAELMAGLRAKIRAEVAPADRARASADKLSEFFGGGR